MFHNSTQLNIKKWKNQGLFEKKMLYSHHYSGKDTPFSISLNKNVVSKSLAAPPRTLDDQKHIPQEWNLHTFCNINIITAVVMLGIHIIIFTASQGKCLRVFHPLFPIHCSAVEVGTVAARHSSFSFPVKVSIHVGNRLPAAQAHSDLLFLTCKLNPNHWCVCGVNYFKSEWCLKWHHVSLRCFTLQTTAFKSMHMCCSPFCFELKLVKYW